MNVLSKTILIAAICGMPVIASARDTDSNPSGPYVGGSVGQFNLHIKNLDGVDDAVSNIKSSDDNAWKVYAGYRFMPYLSLEAAYIDFGQQDNTFSATGSDGNYRVKMSGFAPELIGTLPLGPVELFGKVGQYYYNVDTRVDFDSSDSYIRTTHSRNDFLWGGGVSVVLIKHLALRAEYEKIEIQDAPHSDALWLGAAWRF